MDFSQEKINISSEARLGIFLIIFLGIFIICEDFFVESKPVIVNSISISATSDKEIIRGDTSKRQVIFTFDGGDSDKSAEKILEALANHNIKATFFLTGKFIEDHEEITKQIFSAGHEIFSHTYDHPHLTEISNEDISVEFKKMESVLRQVVGTSSRPFFRPPYGDRDQRVINRAFKEGYQSVYWTVDAMDWEESEGKTAEEVKDIIMSNLAPGNIYLMHIGDMITGNILDDVLTSIENRGYRIVSLREGL